MQSNVLCLPRRADDVLLPYKDTFHKMTGTFFRAKISRLKPRKIYHRIYKNFDKCSFLLNLRSINLYSSSIDPDKNYILLTSQFLKVVNQHAPLKVKTLRRNHAYFVDKQLRKEIYQRSKLRNKYCKNPSEQMQPYIRYKEINERLYVEDTLKTVSLRY